jgi:hypothetical protein
MCFTLDEIERAFSTAIVDNFMGAASHIAEAVHSGEMHPDAASNWAWEQTGTLWEALATSLLNERPMA